MKPYLIILFSVFIIFITLSSNLNAQGPPPPFVPNAPSQAPIDGGLGLLAAAGGAYAIKKLRDKTSSKQNQDLEF